MAMRHVERARWAGWRTGAGAALLAGLTLVSGPGAASAAGVSVDLDQWAPLAAAWQNGDLNGNNARYPEGGVVPFRLAIEKLSPGNHSVTISYDFTASGHKAYDFLATWNATNYPGLCVPSGGAISSMCPRLPAPSSFAFPSDPYTANRLSVAGAQAWSGVSRRLTIYGGTITSIGRPVHHGSVDGNSDATILVRFRATGSAVLMAWGGHLAQSSYWDTLAGGGPDGAKMVSGAPWHMRTLNLDGGGARNQDRSIQPSAIVGELPPAVVVPTPRPTPPPGGSSGGGGTPPRQTIPPGFGLPPTWTAGTDQAAAPDGSASRWVGSLMGLTFAASLVLVTVAGRRRRARRR
jgi:hypothetical protein